MEELQSQSLTEHLRDLRSCLVAVLAAVAAGFAACYPFAEPLGEILFRPLKEVLPPGSTLIFTSYQEGFFFI